VYPEDVVGLVFTNSSNRVGLQAKGKGGLIWDLPEDEVRSAFPLPPAVKKEAAPNREGDPFDRLPADLQAIRLWLDMRLWEHWDRAKASPDSLLSWRKEFLLEFAETDAGRKPPLGELPVIVVSSDPSATESERQSRNGAAARLTSSVQTRARHGDGQRPQDSSLSTRSGGAGAGAGGDGSAKRSSIVSDLTSRASGFRCFARKQIRVDGDPGNPG